MNKIICDKISRWLLSYLQDNSLSSFIVGVSGGIDSAVVSTLCAKTGKPTIVLNIPINSRQSNTVLSTKHCNWLAQTFSNVISHNIDLSSVYKNFTETISGVIETNELALANTKSRLRMVLLYQFATTFNGIVVGTGNKIEDFGVGFYTKYGDGGVDISPIADLTKSQVRQLADLLGVDREIIAAPPTDGLWEDSRTDEEQIGASYEELEWAMDYIDNNRAGDLSARQKEVLNIFTGYKNKNLHKMKPIPIFILEENK